LGDVVFCGYLPLIDMAVVVEPADEIAGDGALAAKLFDGDMMCCGLGKF